MRDSKNVDVDPDDMPLTDEMERTHISDCDPRLHFDRLWGVHAFPSSGFKQESRAGNATLVERVILGVEDICFFPTFPAENF